MASNNHSCFILVLITLSPISGNIPEIASLSSHIKVAKLYYMTFCSALGLKILSNDNSFLDTSIVDS